MKMLALSSAALFALTLASYAADTTSKHVDEDKQFLQKAAMGGNGEVALGKLAILKGGSEDIKTIGKVIVTDHMAMNASLTPFVQQLGAQPPQPLSAADQAELDKLSHMDGHGFDQEYISYEVVDHRIDIKDFSKEISDTDNKQLKATCRQGLSMIRQHLLKLENIAKADGMPVPRA